MLRRLLTFFVFFSAIPFAGSILAAVFYRQGGGVRDTSALSLGVLAWRADPGFLAREVATVVVGTSALAVALGLASLLAWNLRERGSLLRTARFVLLVWFVAIVLYPGMAGWLPFLRQLPWLLVVLLMLCVLGIAYSRQRVRAGLREWVFALVALMAIFYSPGPSTENLGDKAGRAFTPQDIVLIGFDSTNVNDTLDVLQSFQPTHGQKIVFTHAQTPFPATSVAWRSMLGGQFPPHEAAIPNLRWGAHGEGWLPRDLRAVGYDPTIAQDIPESNWFGTEEGLRVVGLQGWKASSQALLWKAAFPLSAVGGSWWVGLLGGPGTMFSRPAHCAECFVANSLKDMAKAASKGPVFWVIHTCLAHGPHQLTFTEATSVPGWWRLPGAFFLGQGTISQDPRSRGPRMATLRGVLRRTLHSLDEGGVLGHATVFILADHGPRGEAVPKETTNRVMLAMFSPLDRGSATVTTPVSLVDIAPTVRRILGLPDVPTDGQVLPRDDTEGDPRRVVRTMSVGPMGSFDSMGIGRKSLSPEELSKLGQLQADGTFDYSHQTLEAVRKFYK